MRFLVLFYWSSNTLIVIQEGGWSGDWSATNLALGRYVLVQDPESSWRFNNPPTVSGITIEKTLTEWPTAATVAIFTVTSTTNSISYTAWRDGDDEMHGYLWLVKIG